MPDRHRGYRRAAGWLHWIGAKPQAQALLHGPKRAGESCWRTKECSPHYCAEPRQQAAELSQRNLALLWQIYSRRFSIPIYALRDLNQTLAQRGVTMIIAGRRTEFLDWLLQIGIYRPDHDTIVFPTLRQAVKAFQISLAHPERPFRNSLSGAELTEQRLSLLGSSVSKPSVNQP